MGGTGGEIGLGGGGDGRGGIGGGGDGSGGLGFGGGKLIVFDEYSAEQTLEELIVQFSLQKPEDAKLAARANGVHAWHLECKLHSQATFPANSHSSISFSHSAEHSIA